MPLIEILDVPAPILEPDRPARFALEAPRPGQHFEGLILEVEGWFSTEREGARIEARRDGEIVLSVEPGLPRPDVRVRYPDENGVGFLGRIAVADWGETRFDLQASFPSGPPIALGAIRARRIWREEASGTEMPLVSVVVSGSEGTLEATLESVFTQSYANFEALLVVEKPDGGLPLDRFPGTRIVAPDAPGSAAARNTGIRRTIGDYLLFLDGGEVLLPDAVRLALETFRDHPEAAVVLGHGEDAGRCLSDDALALFRRSVFESAGVFRPGKRSMERLLARIAEVFPWHCRHPAVAGGPLR